MFEASALWQTAAVLDLDRLKRIKLHRRPLGQRLVAELVLRADYRFPKKTEIILEGLENIPRDRGVYFAMNHTDRYNYWPFQYQMYREGLRFTATWVKGKYYENRWMAAFLDANNNIPLPSRGYVLSTDFRARAGRVPTENEYRVLRALTEDRDVSGLANEPALKTILDKSGGPDAWADRFEALFEAMMNEVVRLTRSALTDLDLNILVFPQGTRSKRLSKGHNGLMQMAQNTGHAIVPVGCNGSDRAYPGGSPFSKGGRIVYRIGKPLDLDGPELGAHRVREAYIPFSRGAAAFEDRFSASTRVVMDHIDLLLDPEYRYSEDQSSDGVEGGRRFL